MEEKINLNGNEVELLLQELDKKSKLTPIKDVEYFIKVLMLKDKEYDEAFNSELESMMQIEKILKSRFECFGYKITNLAVTAMVSIIEDIRPGNLVTYATFLAYKCKEMGMKEINVDTICRIFPMGTFSLKDLEEFWDKQKGGNASTSNLLDDSKACESLKYKED